MSAPALVFRVSARWFAVPVASVREVVVKSTITRVPGAQPSLLGLAMVRGRLVAITSLRSAEAASEAAPEAATLPRVIVLEAGGDEIGIVADETLGVFDELPRDRLVAMVDPGAIQQELMWTP